MTRSAFPTDWADVMVSDQLERMDLIVGSGWVKSILSEGENRVMAFHQPECKLCFFQGGIKVKH